MIQLRLALTGVLLTVGCASARFSNPVTADTRGASVGDGYEAALATVESAHYTVVVDDKQHSFLRVAAQTQKERCRGCTFDIQAWQGSVDVYLQLPPGNALNDTDTQRLHEEGANLAWAIAHRARTLAGPTGVPWSPDYSYGINRDLPTLVPH